jgi:hypothetical protein
MLAVSARYAGPAGMCAAACRQDAAAQVQAVASRPPRQGRVRRAVAVAAGPAQVVGPQAQGGSDPGPGLAGVRRETAVLPGPPARERARCRDFRAGPVVPTGTAAPPGHRPVLALDPPGQQDRRQVQA